MAFPVVILAPGRPLWPAQTLLSKLASVKPGDLAIARALNVYTTYAKRPDPMAEVRERLPAGLKVVGFLGTPDDIDISFWRPFGKRIVKHLVPADSAEEIRKRGIQYAVVSEFCLESHGMTVEQWQKQTEAEIVGSATVVQKIAEGLQRWQIARFP